VPLGTAKIILEDDPGSRQDGLISSAARLRVEDMKRRATFLSLFLALLVLAVARWIFDGVRWVTAPRRRPARIARTPRPATAK
jgi:hypothetical protein